MALLSRFNLASFAPCVSACPAPPAPAPAAAAGAAAATGTSASTGACGTATGGKLADLPAARAVSGSTVLVAGGASAGGAVAALGAEMAASDVPPPPPADGGRGAVLPALLGRVLDVLMSCASGSAKMGRKGAGATRPTRSFAYAVRRILGAILTGKDESCGPFKINWRRIGGGKVNSLKQCPAFPVSLFTAQSTPFRV